MENAKVRAMQFFVSNVIWNDKKIISKYRSLVSEDMGDSDGALIFDEKTGHNKKRVSL